MRTGKLAVRIDPDESVAAIYARDLEELPDALFLRIGALCLSGRPHVVMEVLNRAAQKCWSAWASYHQGEVGGGQDGAGVNGHGDFHVSVISPGDSPPQCLSR